MAEQNVFPEKICWLDKRYYCHPSCSAFDASAFRRCIVLDWMVKNFSGRNKT